MKNRLKLLLVSMFALYQLPAIAEVAVIVHPSNTSSFEKGDINRIFLGKKGKFSDGAKAIPIYLAQGHEARDQFNKKALGKSASQLKAYWSKLIFTGKGSPPDALGNIEDVLAKVASEEGAIAYISADKVDDSVKVVMTY